MTQYSQVKKLQAEQKVNVRRELMEFEAMISELKIQYEQFFLGVQPIQPEKLHKDVQQRLRKLFTLPFKSSAMTYQLKTLENRYSTYNSYWQRVLREKEEGTYSKDIFKLELREKHAKEDLAATTSSAKADKHIKDLFLSYKDTLEKVSGRAQNIQFNDFHKIVLEKAKAIRNIHGQEGQKLSFKVVVKNGKVSLNALVK
jgi:hypothetical protein